MELVTRVTHPLISSKVAQNSSKYPLESVGIDRIEGYFQAPENTKSSLKKYFKAQRRSFYKLDIEGFELEVRFIGNKLNSYFFNPNHLRVKSSFIESIPRIILRDILNSKVTRLDLNIDLKAPFHEVHKNLNVKYKQVSSTHINRSGESLNLKLGKDDEVISLYKKNDSVTRIEKRIRNKKLPLDRSLKGILEWSASENHFENVSVTFFELTPHALKLLPIYKKTRSFFNLYELGITYSKKKHPVPKNFERDLKKFANLSSCNLIPDSAFQALIRERFKIDSK